MDDIDPVEFLGRDGQMDDIVTFPACWSGDLWDHPHHSFVATKILESTRSIPTDLWILNARAELRKPNLERLELHVA
jgi:hypothetical protein